MSYGDARPKIRPKVLEMGQGFILDGKPVDEGILYYWSVVAISRALRFRAEACQQLVSPQTNGYVSAAWAVYYSMFHLGVFVAFSAPGCLEDDMRKRMRAHWKPTKMQAVFRLIGTSRLV